jgi:hypothetical protein
MGPMLDLSAALARAASEVVLRTGNVQDSRYLLRLGHALQQRGDVAEAWGNLLVYLQAEVAKFANKCGAAGELITLLEHPRDTEATRSDVLNERGPTSRRESAASPASSPQRANSVGRGAPPGCGPRSPRERPVQGRRHRGRLRRRGRRREGLLDAVAEVDMRDAEQVDDLAGVERDRSHTRRVRVLGDHVTEHVVELQRRRFKLERRAMTLTNLRAAKIQLARSETSWSALRTRSFGKIAQAIIQVSAGRSIGLFDSNDGATPLVFKEENKKRGADRNEGVLSRGPVAGTVELVKP